MNIWSRTKWKNKRKTELIDLQKKEKKKIKKRRKLMGAVGWLISNLMAAFIMLLLCF